MAFLTGDLKLDFLGVIIIILTTIYFYYQRAFQYWKKKNIPYLPGSIPFGSLVPPYKEIVGDSLAKQYQSIKAKGWKFCGMYFLGKPNLFVLDLELLKLILTKDFDHFVDRGFYVNEEYENITGHLFGLGGSKWKRIRRELTPTFTSGKLRYMFQLLLDCSTLLEQYIEEVAEHKLPVNIKTALECFTTDVIGTCAFGLNCNSFKEKDHPFVKYGKKIFDNDMLTIFKQIFANKYRSIAKFFNLRFFPKDCSDFYNNIIKQTVEYREKNNVKRNDFLQILIDIKNNGGKHESGEESGLTLDEIIAQSFLFFVAGFETSSTTMTFALFELARHSEIQDNVRQEIHKVLKKYNNKITYDALKDMTYLGQVLDETLRMYPPLGFLTRECTLDYKVPGSDLVIEKGIEISFSVKGIHYDEEYYENPYEFQPDRFTDENKKNRHQYAHMPFGEGQRMCLGKRFAINQSKMGLVTVLKNHRISLNEKTKLPLKIALSSPVIPVVEGGIWLNIEKI